MTITDPLYVIECMAGAIEEYRKNWGDKPVLIVVNPEAKEAIDHFYDQDVTEFDGVGLRVEEISPLARCPRIYV